ncbi:MAG: guanylate kinase [Gaiellales bacterium]
MSARLFVVSGPSGVGKGTLIARVREQMPELAVATSATTRHRRPDEAEGREYYFLAPEEFDRRAAGGEFLEHVSYAGNRYGTLRSEVDRRLANGESVVLEIEVVGAREIKRSVPGVVLVFVAPPTIADLEHRLRGRATDPPAEIERRIAIARGEMDAQPEFDYTITNDDVDRAAGELAELMRAAINAPEEP